MSLQPLQWRKLPVRTIPNARPTASYVLNTIYDMLTGSLYHDGSTRTLGSGSAWQMPTKFVTGSNTEAVYVFPGFQTAISQSVIFVSRGQIGASSSFSFPSTVIYENSFSSSFIYIACVKNASASFTQWTSIYPFGSGSAFSGYAPFAQTNQISANHKIVLYESKEALAVYMYDTTKVSTATLGFAGAIIDPEQSGSSADTEIDGRLYAVATSGVAPNSGSQSGLTPSFVSENGGEQRIIFQHSTSASTGTVAYPRFVYFSPNTTTGLAVSSTKKNDTNYPNNLTYSNYTTLSGKLVRTPVYCHALPVQSGTFLGRLRDISVIRQMPSNAVVRDSSNNILGYSFGYTETTASQAMLLNYS